MDIIPLSKVWFQCYNKEKYPYEVIKMAKKDPAKKILDLKEQMKKLEQQLKEQERKRDEELGKLFREEWDINDSETARLIIDSLKSEVDSLKESLSGKKSNNEPIENSNSQSAVREEVASSTLS